MGVEIRFNDDNNNAVCKKQVGFNGFISNSDPYCLISSIDDDKSDDTDNANNDPLCQCIKVRLVDAEKSN